MLILLSANLCLAQSQMLLPSVLSGDSININLQEGFHQFYSGINTHTMGANGSILGPTVILKQGDLVNFAVVSDLENFDKTMISFRLNSIDLQDFDADFKTLSLQMTPKTTIDSKIIPISRLDITLG